MLLGYKEVFLTRWVQDVINQKTGLMPLLDVFIIM